MLLFYHRVADYFAIIPQRIALSRETPGGFWPAKSDVAYAFTLTDNRGVRSAAYRRLPSKSRRMVNMGTSLTALAAFLALLVAVWIVAEVYSGKQIVPAAEVAPIQNSVAQRLLMLANQRADYRIMVGIPLAAPTEWARVVKVDDSTIDIESLGTQRLNDIRTFFVAYPNGQLVDFEARGLSLPKDITGLWGTSSSATTDFLRDDDLKVGKKRIRIEYGKCAARPKDLEHYSTTLTNLTDQRIRVVRFAGYHRHEDSWKLATVTRKFYSAEEFREWYGLGKEVWIAPGKGVADPNNYGGRPVLWAYYCETEAGEKFIAGEVLE